MSTVSHCVPTMTPPMPHMPPPLPPMPPPMPPMPPMPPPLPPSSILPLLKALAASPQAVSPEAVTDALALVFTDQLSPVQTAALLTALHFTRLDQDPRIIAAAARAMRSAGLPIPGLPADVAAGPTSSSSSGAAYAGGLVDIVGTGGDGHNTFNVSTTSAILASGCGLRVCKHGNRASTSASGSADILTSLGAVLTAVTADVAARLFSPPDAARFCFLFAPVFHPGMRHAAGVRRELGFRTIFNLLGPLVNPVDYSVPGGLEARVIGVGRRELGAVFARTLGLLGCRKGMVVCGEEGLDEVSCERRTECWLLVPPVDGGEGGGQQVDHFWVHPTETFGLPAHPLHAVAGGRSADENAGILERVLKGAETQEEVPVRDFVLLNTAALLAVSGAVGAVGRVREGEVAAGAVWRAAVERAREGISSGQAWREWVAFAEASRRAEGGGA